MSQGGFEEDDEEFDGVLAWQQSRHIVESVRNATNLNRATKKSKTSLCPQPKKRRRRKGFCKQHADDDDETEDELCGAKVLTSKKLHEKTPRASGGGGDEHEVGGGDGGEGGGEEGGEGEGQERGQGEGQETSDIVLEDGDALLVPTMPSEEMSPLTATQISFASQRALERMRLQISCSHSLLAHDVSHRCAWTPMMEPSRTRRCSSAASRVLCLQGRVCGGNAIHGAFLLRSEHDGIPSTALPQSARFGIIASRPFICNALRPRTVVVSAGTGRGEDRFAVTLGHNECLFFQSNRAPDDAPLSFQLFPLDRGTIHHDAITIAVITFS